MNIVSEYPTIPDGVYIASVFDLQSITSRTRPWGFVWRYKALVRTAGYGQFIVTGFLVVDAPRAKWVWEHLFYDLDFRKASGVRVIPALVEIRNEVYEGQRRLRVTNLRRTT